MLYKSSYYDITLLVRETHSQKSGHVAFWRFVGPKCKESGYRQFQQTTYFTNALEFVGPKCKESGYSQFQQTTYFTNALEFARTVKIWTRVIFPRVKSLPAHQWHKSLP